MLVFLEGMVPVGNKTGAREGMENEKIKTPGSSASPVGE
jgi:hypothetical protein